MLRHLLLFLFLIAPAAVQASDLDAQLIDAVRKSDIAAVKTLLEKGAGANAKYRYDRSVLSIAADRGNIEIVKLLLDRGADPNSKDTFYGATAMTWAVSKNHVDVVRLLLAKGADAGRDSALNYGVTRGHMDIVKTVLDRGSVPQATLNTALSRALRSNQNEIAEALKKAGAVPPFSVDTDILKTYEGVYKADQGELVVTLKDGRLTGAPRGQPPVVLDAIDRITFKPADFDGLRLTFEVTDGKVVGASLRQGENVTKYQKVQTR